MSVFDNIEVKPNEEIISILNNNTAEIYTLTDTQLLFILTNYDLFLKSYFEPDGLTPLTLSSESKIQISERIKTLDLVPISTSILQGIVDNLFEVQDLNLSVLQQELDRRLQYSGSITGYNGSGKISSNNEADDVLGLYTGFYSSMQSSPTSFSFLENLTDPGIGDASAIGGVNANGQAVALASPVLTDPLLDFSADSTYQNIDQLLGTSLTQNWQTTNSRPGNPLIIEAYAISGRTYDRDGATAQYNWNAAFANWILSRAGVQHPISMSPVSYRNYGQSVEFGTFSQVRKNDIIVFVSANNRALVGFVRGYNRQTNQIRVIGGNLDGVVKEIDIPFSRTDPSLRVTNVRRNWTIPESENVPLFEFTLPGRPGQQTSGPAQFPTTGRVPI